MSKLVVSEFMSLDGVMEDPGGGEPFERGGWAFKFERSADGNRFKYEELMDAGAMLLGRVTYEGFAQAWPNMRGDEFGEKMNSMPKYVVSSTLQSADWENSTILTGNLADRVGELKQSVEGNLLVAGSAQLVQALTALRLVDEYRLMVYPIVLGAGKRLFGETGAAHMLKLTDVASVGEAGVFTLTYTAAE
ncbi:MAG TPA: dihydrofolate reductase family protein [Solirubrobacteraceae bacterium]|jgi:dihydrofolate reductase|nr:dihydrofolate reductase family protein [Solirubrobacteraceae bacterium]